ncbi:MAG: type II secretion system F family protein [Thalassovita sp.]
MLELLTRYNIGSLELGVFVTVTILAAALMFASNPQSGSAKLRKRVQRVGGNQLLNVRAGEDPIDAEMRKRQIRSAMKDTSGNQSTSILTKMRQAGLDWSRRKYLLVTLACIVALSVVLLAFTTLPPPVSGILGLIIGALAPYIYVKRSIKKRLKRFSNEFPTALDIIVRGVSAGLPLSECIKTIAREAKEPVRSEFQMLINDQSVGMPLEKAVHRLATRVPLAETSFFAIVLAVQSRSGGSLAEILSNLSSVVRGRKMLDAQIKTMSAEAKMSGRMIGSMPLLVAGALFYLSPDYIATLTGTGIGRMILMGCAFWMFTGVMIMKKMINFDV